MTRLSLLFSLLALGCFAIAGPVATIPAPEATVIIALIGIGFAIIAAVSLKSPAG